MSELPHLARTNRALLVVFILGLVGFVVSQTISFRMERQSQALQRRVIAQLEAAERSDSIAAVERRAAVSTISTLRTDLNALIRTGRARSISRDRRLERLERDMRHALAGFDSTVDSVRLVLPPAKKRR